MSRVTAPVRPHELIWNISNAVITSRSLHVAAELAIADRIDETPVTSAQLARDCGVDPTALDRILQLLVAHGVFTRTDAGYAHTDASRLLRDDHPMSMRAFARLMNLPVCRTSYGALEHAVRTGAPSVELADPNGFFAYLQRHPEEARVFGEAMAAKAQADITTVLDAYDFRPFRAIADVGGGRGHLLRAILEAVPTARGVLFELPSVIDTLEPSTDHRLATIAGDFFVDPLPTADAYLLMEVLHDWADGEAVGILRAIRRAAGPGASVLIIEDVLPDMQADPRARTLDVLMLMVTGGRERSASQFADLLQSADFRLTAVIETAGPMRIVEGVAV
jgi:O-methyltransferase